MVADQELAEDRSAMTLSSVLTTINNTANSMFRSGGVKCDTLDLRKEMIDKLGKSKWNESSDLAILRTLNQRARRTDRDGLVARVFLSNLAYRLHKGEKGLERLVDKYCRQKLSGNDGSWILSKLQSGTGRDEFQKLNELAKVLTGFEAGYLCARMIKDRDLCKRFAISLVAHLPSEEVRLATGGDLATLAYYLRHSPLEPSIEDVDTKDEPRPDPLEDAPGDSIEFGDSIDERDEFIPWDEDASPSRNMSSFPTVLGLETPTDPKMPRMMPVTEGETKGIFPQSITLSQPDPIEVQSQPYERRLSVSMSESAFEPESVSTTPPTMPDTEVESSYDYMPTNRSDTRDSTETQSRTQFDPQGDRSTVTDKDVKKKSWFSWRAMFGTGAPRKTAGLLPLSLSLSSLFGRMISRFRS